MSSEKEAFASTPRATIFESAQFRVRGDKKERKGT